MNDADSSKIKEKISIQHEGDEKQLEVIFSDNPRLIVEAPAGYGKTTTMISRIAYLFATGGVPNPKRILGLTFSVNAALKVKREVAEKLPGLLGARNSPISISEKVTITNYHGFCKGVLRKYGYLIADALRKDVNLFRAIDDKNIFKTNGLETIFTKPEENAIFNIKQSIEGAHIPEKETIQTYNRTIISKLLPQDYITHNAVILFVLEIFERFPEVRKFYQGYYPVIVVDEFQDTNCIAWQLLESLITVETKLVFLGDSLQRIYGFIGALPDIMAIAAGKYKMCKITLGKNYRFCNNPEMLKLDANIRLNAAYCFAPTVSETAMLPVLGGETQESEAIQVAGKVNEVISGSKDRIAILFRMRSRGAEIIEEQLKQSEVSYFYGMFTDEDPDYVNFHNECLILFSKKFSKTKSINKRSLTVFADNMREKYCSDSNKTNTSLLRLLDALIEKVSTDYSDLPIEEKYNLIIDIFENRQLKQAMEYVDSQVILSTIHGAKGLEWDYVILADVEQWVLTFSSCKKCPSKDIETSKCCRLPDNIPEEMKNQILDDLCVFYVGLTRARKQAYISASAERFNANGVQYKNGKVSCLASINGIKLKNENKIHKSS